MQTISQIGRKRAAIGSRDAPNRIERIADQRISVSGKVNADLMWTARGDSDFKERPGIDGKVNMNKTIAH